MGVARFFGKAKKVASGYVAPDPAQARAEAARDTLTKTIEMTEEKTGLLAVSDEWMRDIDEADLMLEHLFEIAEGHDWFDIDEEDENLQLLTVKSSQDVYRSKPLGEEQTTLEFVARGLNCDACMVMVTDATRTLIDSSPPMARSIVLGGKINRLVENILPFPTYDSMQTSGICFIREIGGAILWNDDASSLIEYASRWDQLITQLVFSEKEKLTSQEVFGETEEKLETQVEERELTDEEANLIGETRPVRLEWAATVGLTFVVMGLLTGTIVKSSVFQYMQSEDWKHLLYLLYVPVVVVLTSFFLNQIVSAILQLIGPIAHMHTNSKYYSHNRPTTTIARKDLPHVTIHCPAYKEDLWDVIDPTVQSCRAAIATYEAQGGTANLLISDDGAQLRSPDQQKIREQYYATNGVAWTARRPHGKDGFQRRGLFKKAGNLNHGIQLSIDIEQRYNDTKTKDGDVDEYDRARKEILEERNGVDWCGGDIGLGSIVFIIDCDTRVPVDCILDAVLEFRDSPEVSIIQHIGDALLLGSDFWELGMAFFIRRVFFGIRYCVAGGDLCPFLGHNAFLRWSAMEEVARRRDDGSLEWWSEAHVSEDFEIALRCQVAGYTTRMATYNRDEFREGVSLTVYDEIARWSKYAWGCSELMFNPFKFWFKQGPFGDVIKQFVKSPRISVAAKCSSLFYMWTYWLIALSWVYTIANYFLFGWFKSSIDRAYIDQFNIIIAVSVVFGIRDLIVVPWALFRLREASLRHMITDSLRHFWLPIWFFQGLSMHIARATVQHLIDVKMPFGSTAKSLDATILLEELPGIFRKYRVILLLNAFFAAMMIVLRFAVPKAFQIDSITAIFPLAWMVAFHISNPVILNASSWLSELVGFVA